MPRVASRSRWADRFLIRDRSASETLVRLAWTAVVVVAFPLQNKLTTVIAFCVLAGFWVLRLQGRGGRGLRVALLAFVIVLVLPVDLSFRDLPGPPRFVELVHGMPGRDLFERAAQGELVLAGCIDRPFEADLIWVW
jgi:hypothetical protein